MTATKKKPRKAYKPKNRAHPFIRFTRQSRVDISLCHHINLDAIATGTADAQTLLDFVHSAFTWMSFAKTPEEEAIAAEAAELCSGLLDRFKRTLKVGCSGEQLQTARRVTAWMDEMAARANPDEAMVAVKHAAAVIDGILPGVYRAMEGRV